MPGEGRRRASILVSPRLFPLLIVAAGLAAYRGSFAGVFLLDDQTNIVQNHALRHPWGSVSSNETRPLVIFSLALNYAWGGLDPRGYHAVNLAIHILAALALYGVVRRTLLRRPEPGLSRAASGLALGAALLWAVHPLQTESVTYIIQRAEALAGLFSLLSLYCAVRGVEAESGRPAWYAAAVICCGLGMLSKQTTCTTPVLILLYDVIFLAARFAEIFRRRWLYAGLAATWLLLAGSVPATLGTDRSPRRDTSVGFSSPNRPADYALSQPEVIVHYLKLAFWPDRLCLDYAWPAPRTVGSVVPPALVLGALLLATLWALRRRPELGFLGLWFFGALAPRSSIVPSIHLAVEHRMYLPLAALAVLVVLAIAAAAETAGACLGAGQGLRRWTATGLIGILVGAAAWRTDLRNRDYRSAVVMWSDVVAQSPWSSRAQNNLGQALAEAGSLDEALEHYAAALRINPRLAEANANLGAGLLKKGDLGAAERLCGLAVQLNPYSAPSRNALGAVFQKQGKVEKAIEQYAAALRLDPEFGLARLNLGKTYGQQEQWGEAATQLAAAAHIDPLNAEAHALLGRSLQKQGKLDEAIEHARTAVRIDPERALAHAVLGSALWRKGRAAEAIDHERTALRLDPRDAETHINLGVALQNAGNLTDAVAHYTEALHLKPASAVAHNNLGAVLQKQGKPAEAVEHLNAALRLAPNYANALANLGLAYEREGQWERAAACHRRAVALAPRTLSYRCNLAYALRNQGQTEEAGREYREILRLAPDWPRAASRAAWALATSTDPARRDGQAAVRLAEQACQATAALDPMFLDALAAAYAEVGRYEDAVVTARRALTFAMGDARKGLAPSLRERLRLYRDHRPFHGGQS